MPGVEFMVCDVPYDDACYACAMSVISFRSDPEIDQALITLGATDGSRTDVIKQALIEAARHVRGEQIRARACYLARDPDDLAESQAIREDMESVSAW